MINPRLHIIDLVVWVAANLINLLVALMFLFRGRGRPEVGRAFGWGAVALGIPLAAAATLNLLAGRSWATWVLPLVTVAYCAIELVLDGILKVDFRSSRWLGPYLGLFYLGLFAMIGYTFLVGRPYGFTTLVTYFINLAATYYSYSRVGHS